MKTIQCTTWAWAFFCVHCHMTNDAVEIFKILNLLHTIIVYLLSHPNKCGISDTQKWILDRFMAYLYLQWSGSLLITEKETNLMENSSVKTVAVTIMQSNSVNRLHQNFYICNNPVAIEIFYLIMTKWILVHFNLFFFFVLLSSTTQLLANYWHCIFEYLVLI